MNEERIAENGKKGVYLPYLALPTALVAGIAYWLIAGRYITLTTNLVPYWVGFVVLAIAAVFLALLLFSLQKVNPSGISALRKKSVPLAILFLFPTLAGLFYSSTMITNAFETKIPNIYMLIIGVLYLFYAMFMVLTSVQFFIAKNVSPTKSPFLPFIAIVPFCIESVMLALKNPTSLYRITSTLHMAGFILAITWFAILIHSFYVAMHFKRMQFLYVTGFMLFLFSTCFGIVRIITELQHTDGLALSALAELFILPTLGLAAGGVSLWIAFCGKQQVAIAVPEDNFLFDLDTMLLPNINADGAQPQPTPVDALPADGSVPAESYSWDESSAPAVQQEQPFMQEESFAIEFHEDSPDAQDTDENATPAYPMSNFFSGFAQDNDTSPFGESFFDDEVGSDTFDDDFLKHTSTMPYENGDMVKPKAEEIALDFSLDSSTEYSEPQTAQDDDFLFATKETTSESPAVQAVMLDLFAAEEAPPTSTASQPDFLDIFTTTDNLDDALLDKAIQHDLFATAGEQSYEKNSNVQESIMQEDVFTNMVDNPPHTQVFGDTNFFDAESGPLDDAFLNQKGPHSLHTEDDNGSDENFQQAEQSFTENYTPPQQAAFYSEKGAAPPLDLFAEVHSPAPVYPPQDFQQENFQQAEQSFTENYTPPQQAAFYSEQGAVPPLDLFAEVHSPAPVYPPQDFQQENFQQAEQSFTENYTPPQQAAFYNEQGAVPPLDLLAEVHSPAPVYPPQDFQQENFQQAEQSFPENYTPPQQAAFYSEQGAAPPLDLFAEVHSPAPVYPPQDFQQENFQQAEQSFTENYTPPQQAAFYSEQGAVPPLDLFAEVHSPAPVYPPQDFQQENFQQAEQNFTENYTPPQQAAFYSEQGAVPPLDLFAEVHSPAPAYPPQDFQQENFQQAEQSFFNEDAFISGEQYAAQPLPAQPVPSPIPKYIYEPLMPAPTQTSTAGLKTPVVQSSATINLRVEEILAELELESNAKSYAPTPVPQNNKPAGKRIFKRNT